MQQGMDCTRELHIQHTQCSSVCIYVTPATHTLGIHSRTVLSRDADASRWPVGLNCTDRTASYTHGKRYSPPHTTQGNQTHASTTQREHPFEEEMM